MMGRDDSVSRVWLDVAREAVSVLADVFVVACYCLNCSNVQTIFFSFLVCVYLCVLAFDYMYAYMYAYIYTSRFR
jgi:hypothetical protein